MACPLNQKNCHIIAHPDSSKEAFFCTTCKQFADVEFKEKSQSFPVGPFLVALTVAIVGIVKIIDSHQSVEPSQTGDIPSSQLRETNR